MHQFAPPPPKFTHLGLFALHHATPVPAFSPHHRLVLAVRTQGVYVHVPAEEVDPMHQFERPPPKFTHVDGGLFALHHATPVPAFSPHHLLVLAVRTQGLYVHAEAIDPVHVGAIVVVGAAVVVGATVVVGTVVVGAAVVVGAIVVVGATHLPLPSSFIPATHFPHIVDLPTQLSLF